MDICIILDFNKNAQVKAVDQNGPNAFRGHVSNSMCENKRGKCRHNVITTRENIEEKKTETANSNIYLYMHLSSVYVCGVCADCAFLPNFIAFISYLAFSFAHFKPTRKTIKDFFFISSAFSAVY